MRIALLLLPLLAGCANHSDTGTTDTGATDTGATDTGATGTHDTSTADTGSTDTSTADTGTTDTGTTDTATTDTGPVGGGPVGGGPGGGAITLSSVPDGCTQDGVVRPDTGEVGVWAAAEFTPPSTPFTVTAARFDVGSNTDCDSSGTFHMRLWVTSDNQPPDGNGTVDPGSDFETTLSAGAASNGYATLSATISPPLAVGPGEKVYVAVDSNMPSTKRSCFGACIDTTAAPAGTEMWSSNAAPKDWTWIDLSTFGGFADYYYRAEIDGLTGH